MSIKAEPNKKEKTGLVKVDNPHALFSTLKILWVSRGQGKKKEGKRQDPGKGGRKRMRDISEGQREEEKMIESWLALLLTSFSSSLLHQLFSFRLMRGKKPRRGTKIEDACYGWWNVSRQTSIVTKQSTLNETRGWDGSKYSSEATGSGSVTNSNGLSPFFNLWQFSCLRIRRKDETGSKIKDRKRKWKPYLVLDRRLSALRKGFEEERAKRMEKIYSLQENRAQRMKEMERRVVSSNEWTPLSNTTQGRKRGGMCSERMLLMNIKPWIVRQAGFDFVPSSLFSDNRRSFGTMVLVQQKRKKSGRDIHWTNRLHQSSVWWIIHYYWTKNGTKSETWTCTKIIDRVVQVSLSPLNSSPFCSLLWMKFESHHLMTFFHQSLKQEKRNCLKWNWLNKKKSLTKQDAWEEGTHRRKGRRREWNELSGMMMSSIPHCLWSPLIQSLLFIPLPILWYVCSILFKKGSDILASLLTIS